MDRQGIEATIRAAFAGVQLGSGFSLRQAQEIDRRSSMEMADFEALQRDEVTDDWTRIPEAELLRDCIAHLDEEGLRYYLPAFMLWVLDHYDDEDRIFDEGASMAVIGTIMAIAPGSQFDDLLEQDFETSFTEVQRRAIAAYVDALPVLVHLDQEDQTRLARSRDRYWSRYLPS